MHTNLTVDWIKVLREVERRVKGGNQLVLQCFIAVVREEIQKKIFLHPTRQVLLLFRPETSMPIIRVRNIPRNRFEAHKYAKRKPERRAPGIVPKVCP